MAVKVNGKELTIEKPVSVTELLQLSKAEAPEYVTVELNDEFVKRGDFDKTQVKDGDVVEFLYYMGGGAQ